METHFESAPVRIGKHEWRIVVKSGWPGREPKRAECACRVVEAALLETFGIDPQAQCRASADLILSQRVCDALNAWNGLYA